MTGGADTPRTFKDHVPVLDGLRGVAVLLVVWAHVPADFLGYLLSWAKVLVKPGYQGVDVFFVLSGFLITRILLADAVSRVPLRHFLLRRFLRIFPIYYLTLLVFWIVRPGPELPWCFAYLSNAYFPFVAEDSPLRHTWSLAVEEHFYLVWPLVATRLPRRAGRVVALLVLAPLAVGFAFWFVRNYDATIARRLVYESTPCRMLSLALGAALAYGEGWIRNKPRQALLLAALAFVLGQIVVQSNKWGERDQLYPVLRLVGFSAVSLGLVLAAIVGRDARTLPAGLLRSAPLRAVGRISYGLYLYHLPIFHALGVGPRQPGWKVVAAVALAFATATVSYLLIERPLLRWKARLPGGTGKA